MTEPEQQPGYTPPFPDPRASRPNLLGRFRAFTRSWLNVFFANSYRMKSGTFRIPGKRYFIINDAPEVKSVLSAGAEAYPKGPVLQRMLRLLLGDGIFISNGAVWRRQRDMMEQALTLSHIRLVFPMMQSAVNQLLQRLQASPENQLNISEEMAYVTADIIFRTIYTKPLTAEESALIFRSFARYQKRVARLSPLFLSVRARSGSAGCWTILPGRYAVSSATTPVRALRLTTTAARMITMTFSAACCSHRTKVDVTSPWKS